MTPSARLQAAITVLDQYVAGTPLEKSLTNWARKSRYAGSKDRAAVRDIVFQCVRCRLSYGSAGGSDTGRGLALGYVADLGASVKAWFDGSDYGPNALSEEEKTILDRYIDSELHVKLDCPKWLMPSVQTALGDDVQSIFETLKTRAPTFVRVNLSKSSRRDVVQSLAGEGIVAIPSDLSSTALEVTENPRKLNNCRALQSGLIELQDAASQAVCETVPAGSDLRILDYCAGGGGKALALADRAHDTIFAHDINRKRMQDIPLRASRAGVQITALETAQLRSCAPFDIVLCDVPCSGSGAWRRSPEGKWLLSREKLVALTDLQIEILHDAAELVANDGRLIYATCSLLREENEDQIERFLAKNNAWTCLFSKRFSPLDGGDGFFVAHLTRN